jgi:DMSO/TMAO reductase YedYZ molybdopterin-dependent catalytic subunit
MSDNQKPWIAQPVPSTHFIARGRGSFEMNYAAVSDIGDDEPTPTPRFYVHNRTTPPAVAVEGWALTIDGDAVGTPLSLAYADFATLPSTTFRAVLDCGANARSFFPTLVPGATLPVGFTQWTWGAMGAAEWTGVPVAVLFEKANVDAGSTWACVTGLDEVKQGEGQTEHYEHVMPAAQLVESHAIVALQMNGAPLTRDHGFPARLFIPGAGGNTAVKWLTSISITKDKPAILPLQQNQMLVGPAYPQPVVPGNVNPKSAFELAMNGTITLSPKTPPPTLYGRAWSADATIVNVGIAIEQLGDDGTWTPVVPRWAQAKLLTTPQRRWWVRFSYEWKHAKPGAYRLYSCATDDQGNTQPPAASVIWNQHGLHYNGVAPHPVTVMPLDNMP